MSVTAPDGSVWPAGSLRALEHTSIRKFVHFAADEGYLRGRVLDYGCGTGPYRRIVEEHGGEWFGYDRAEFPDNHVGDVGDDPFIVRDAFDGVLATQVVQYLRRPGSTLRRFNHRGAIRKERRFFQPLRSGGHLVLSYPTNWPEAQPEDLHRFTKAGMERLLMEAGFEIIHHESRASFTWNRERFSLGGGVIARA